MKFHARAKVPWRGYPGEELELERPCRATFRKPLLKLNQKPAGALRLVANARVKPQVISFSVTAFDVDRTVPSPRGREECAGAADQKRPAFRAKSRG